VRSLPGLPKEHILQLQAEAPEVRQAARDAALRRKRKGAAAAEQAAP
jgi:hypothetical protein